MTIKIMIDNDNNDKVLQPIRSIVLGDQEIYKVVNGVTENKDSLIYGKGIVYFNINKITDGGGRTYPYTSSSSYSWKPSYSWTGEFFGDDWWPEIIPPYLYCFYGEGLFYWEEKIVAYPRKIIHTYYKVEQSFQTFEANIQKLLEWNKKYAEETGYRHPEFEELEFKGWYLNKEGTGTRIKTIDQVYTQLFFKLKSSAEIPTITLYAKWELPTCTIKISNIYKNKVYSSFYYKGKKYTGKTQLPAFKVKFGTSIPEFIRSLNISKVEYTTWAKGYVNNKELEKKLKPGFQKFRGWRYAGYNDYSDTDSLWLSGPITDKYDKLAYHVGWDLSHTKSVRVEPFFDDLIIYPKTKLPNGKTFNGKIVRINPIDNDGEFNDIELDQTCTYGYGYSVPVYGRENGGNGNWIEYSGKYYAWRPDKTDTGYNVERNKSLLLPGCTVVLKFKRIE